MRISGRLCLSVLQDLRTPYFRGTTTVAAMARVHSVTRALGDKDYQELLRLRTELRRFVRQSETWAREAGLTPAQHKLLLAVRGHPLREGPTISDVAGYLLLQHHSVVELVNRAVSAGLVTRHQDRHDARIVRLSLTASGRRALARLSERSVQELRNLASFFRPLLASLDNDPLNGIKKTSGSGKTNGTKKGVQPLHTK